MDPVGQRLHDALMEGLEVHVRSRGARHGLEEGTIETALESCRAVLSRSLRELLRTPYDRQSATPLELFRSSLADLTKELEAAAVSVPRRDDRQVELAPDDPYDLGPASAAEISDDAHEALLAWGVAKASALKRPLVLVVTTNLMDVGSFESAAEATGYRVGIVKPSDVAGMAATVAFVDLEIDGADAAISTLVGEGARVIAYGPHVDSFAMTRARSLGATTAEPRSRVLRDPSVFVLPVV